MPAAAAMLGALSLALAASPALAEIYMKEKFDDGLAGWETSEWKGKECEGDPEGRDECMGKWEHTAGKWPVDAAEQKGLKTTQVS